MVELVTTLGGVLGQLLVTFGLTGPLDVASVFGFVVVLTTVVVGYATNT